jgi:hypothetical protein
MVYLHCGWPKTGTTSLQAVLARRRDQLMAVGTVYPDRWSRKGDDTHNGLTDLVAASRRSGAAINEFKSFLEDHSDRDVLLSSESLSVWVGRKDEALMSLFMAIQEVTSLRCIWTLRRLDDLLQSLYIQMALGGREMAPPAEFMSNFNVKEDEGMRAIERAVTDVSYVKYEPDGGHNVRLLRAFGLPSDEVGAIGAELSSTPRLNVSRTYKQFVAATNVDVVSARLGFKTSRRALRDAFEREGFQFKDDSPCSLVDGSVREEVHGRMLESSRRSGFDAYVEFFGEDEIQGSAVSLNPDILSDQDLSRLADHLQQSGHAREAPQTAAGVIAVRHEI